MTSTRTPHHRFPKIKEMVEFLAALISIPALLVAIWALWPAYDSTQRDHLTWQFNTVGRHAASRVSATGCMITSGIIANTGRVGMTVLGFSDDKEGKRNIPFFPTADTEWGSNKAITQSTPFELDPGQSALVTFINPGMSTPIHAYATTANGKTIHLDASKVKGFAGKTSTGDFVSEGKTLPISINNEREKIVDGLTCETTVLKLTGPQS